MLMSEKFYSNTVFSEKSGFVKIKFQKLLVFEKSEWKKYFFREIRASGKTGF